MEVLFHHWHSHHGNRDKTQEVLDDLTRRDAIKTVEDGAVDLVEAGHGITIPQASLFLLWMLACSLLVARFFYQRRRGEVHRVDAGDVESLASLLQNGSGEEKEEEKREREDKKEEDAMKSMVSNGSSHYHDGAVPDEVKRDLSGHADSSSINQTESQLAGFSDKLKTDLSDFKEAENLRTAPVKLNSSTASASSSSSAANNSVKTFSKVKPPPSFDTFLLHAIGLGAILFYFFLCDVWGEWPVGERVYNRDQFMFLTLIMFLVAGAFTIRTCPDKILNRDQTEEWKGWMQVMFVWYHYFKAAETYNLVRVYIACYVWMTGFGNFSFFWIRKDYSLWRMLKMLFRLNFLVVLVLLVTDNAYMLYYICAMHTYWFLTVYAFMAILRSWNDSTTKMAAKFAVYFVCNAVIFDTPLITYAFKPLGFVLQYEGSLHEWEFRAGLDHYACFVGMLCAYNYPHYERWMNYLDKRHIDQRDRLFTIAIKAFIVGILLVATVIWYRELMFKNKFEYNRIHPYTSWFPILTYIVLRNMVPALRTRYLHFFTFLGKITLETYISQLHIFMQSNAKELIVYLPGYPLLNFTIATFIYLFISYWLFEITTVFSSFLLPQSMRKVGIHIGIGVVVSGLAACLALLLREASFI